MCLGHEPPNSPHTLFSSVLFSASAGHHGAETRQFKCLMIFSHLVIFKQLQVPTVAQMYLNVGLNVHTFDTFKFKIPTFYGDFCTKQEMFCYIISLFTIRKLNKNMCHLQMLYIVY